MAGFVPATIKVIQVSIILTSRMNLDRLQGEATDEISATTQVFRCVKFFQIERTSQFDDGGTPFLPG